MFATIRVAIKFMKGGFALQRAHEHINMAWKLATMAMERDVLTYSEHSKIIEKLGEARGLVAVAMGKR